MKRFFIFLVVVGIALAIGYFWWKTNSQKIISQQVIKIAQSFFTNPEAITVKNDAIKMTGLRSAEVAKLTIFGNNLMLKNGLQFAYAKVVLSHVGIIGPPFHLSKVSSGSYTVKVTDQAVTNYLHKRGGGIGGINVVPLSSMTVKFVKDLINPTILSGKATIPLINQSVPITAMGKLVPASSQGKVDMRISTVKVTSIGIKAKSIENALTVVNPIVDISNWPVICEVTSIRAEQGYVVVQGKIIGIEPSLIN